MVLADKTILELLEKKELVIFPFDPLSLQPASIDMRLGDEFMIADESSRRIVNMSSEIVYKKISGNSFIVEPRAFVLATTEEYVELPKNITAFVEGRSSVGRMGLFIQNAGWVDPGFKGKITLELYNASAHPIEIEKGRRICQLVFCKMTENPNISYNGKYQGQKSVTGSLVHLDREV